MAIRKILVSLSGADSDGPTVGMAMTIAKTFGGQVVGLFVRPDPREALPYLGEAVSGQIVEQLIEATQAGSDSLSAHARAALEKAAAAAGVPVVEKSSADQLPSARYVDVVGNRDDVVMEASRLSDLVVFSESDNAKVGGSALEAALKMADRPVLIVPDDAGTTVGTHVAIGWDRSQEAAQAIIAAIPFLAKAQQIKVFCIAEHARDKSPRTRLTDYLALHGVTAEIEFVDGGGKPDGEVLIEEAKKMSSDLIVMGGYGHIPWRKLLVSSTTEYVQSHAAIPILMAH